MSNVIQKTPGGWKRSVLLLLTLMLAGRAMTLAFLSQLGSDAPGAPPDAWLMPLAGDAVIGVSALLVAALVWRRAGGLGGWAAVVVWNALGIWDALSAFLIHTSVPWPEFFMIQIFGPSMFFAASAMHAVCIFLAFDPEIRSAVFRLEPARQSGAGPASES